MAAENKDGWAGGLCLGAMNSRHSQRLSTRLMSAMTVCVSVLAVHILLAQQLNIFLFRGFVFCNRYNWSKTG